MPSTKIKRTSKEATKVAKETKVTKVTNEPKVAKVEQSWYYEQKQETQQSPEILSSPSPASATFDTSATFAASSSRPSLRCILTAIVIFLFPFITFPWTFSPYDFPKQLFLALIIAVGLIIVLIESSRKGAFELIPRHLFVPLGLLTLIVALVSALRSKLPYQALLGYGGTESLSVLTLLLLGLWILLMFHAGRENSRLPVVALIASGGVLALVTLLSLAGLNLFRFAQTAGFNPAGTTTVAGIIAVATILLALGAILDPRGRATRLIAILSLLCCTLLLLTAALRLPWLILAIGLGLLTLLLLTRGTSQGRSGRRVILLLLGTALAIALTIFHPALPGVNTPLEVSPSHKETWSIMLQTLQESLLFGSGPTSFSSDYLQFRSLPILQTPFWNIAFDWGSSAILTWFTTLGLLGGGFILLTVLAVLLSYLVRSRDNSTSLAIFVAGLALFIASFLTPLPLAAQFFFDTLLGLMLARSALPLRTARREGHVPSPILALSGALILLFIVVVSFVQVRRAAAELLAFQGAQAAGRAPAGAEVKLRRATALDPQNDYTLRLLAEVRRLILRQKLSAGAGGQDPQVALQEIRDLTDQALQAARAGTQRAPGNVANWTVLGSIYLDIAPLTAGAAKAATETFEKTLQLSPRDPALLVNLAVARGLPPEGPVQELAPEIVDSAQKTLERAAKIRPAYALAHLELARLLARTGKIEEALAAYRRAQGLVPDDAALRFEVGLFLLQNKQTDPAQLELKEAIRLAPNFSNARWFLAQTYEEKGELANALEQIQKVLELNPENQQAQSRIAELQKKLEGGE